MSSRFPIDSARKFVKNAAYIPSVYMGDVKKSIVAYSPFISSFVASRYIVVESSGISMSGV